MLMEEIMAASYHRCERTRVPVVVASALLAIASVSPAAADNVRWRTVVGIVQANNVVGGIGGGGQPWTTLGGHASVDLSANHVEFEVRGLVLAGGDSIGTPDNILQVRGTLLCDPAGAKLAIDTVLVPLNRKMGTAWDVAYAALFLASDEAKFITGVALPVDGGALLRASD